MTATTAIVWVVCVLDGLLCHDTTGSVARQSVYRTLVECLDAAHAEPAGPSEILSCKMRTEVTFQFWIKPKGQRT